MAGPLSRVEAFHLRREVARRNPRRDGKRPIFRSGADGSKKACLFILALKWRLWKMTVDGSGLADEVR